MDYTQGTMRKMDFAGVRLHIVLPLVAQLTASAICILAADGGKSEVEGPEQLLSIQHLFTSATPLKLVPIFSESVLFR